MIVVAQARKSWRPTESGLQAHPPLLFLFAITYLDISLRCGSARICLKGFPHGKPTTKAETINTDLLAFLKGTAKAAA